MLYWQFVNELRQAMATREKAGALAEIQKPGTSRILLSRATATASFLAEKMRLAPLVPFRAISSSVLLPHSMIALLYESLSIWRFTSSYSYWFNASCRCMSGFTFLGGPNVTELLTFWDFPEGCTRFQELRDKLIKNGVSKKSFKNSSWIIGHCPVCIWRYDMFEESVFSLFWLINSCTTWRVFSFNMRCKIRKISFSLTAT